MWVIFLLCLPALSSASECGGELTSLEGELTSPNFPAHYPNNAQCTWVITVPDGKVIGVDFQVIDIENSYRCRYDYLLVKDGADGRSPNIGQFCGTRSLKPIISSGTSLFMRFVSDSGDAMKGFKLNWKALDKFSGNCGAELTGATGHFQTPNYPYPYPTSTECVWVITMPAGHKDLTLTFEKFDLEVGDNCRFDHVEIRDGENIHAPLLGKHCGPKLPPAYKSKSGKLWVKLYSDKSQPSNGFVAKYESLQSDDEGTNRNCGMTLSAQTMQNGDAHPGSWPWQAAIVSSDGTGTSFCGGVLLAGDWVITSANCFTESQDVTKYRVKLGKLHFSESDASEQSQDVKEILIHPKWSSGNIDHDLALVRLKNSITKNDNVQPICLTKMADIPSTGYTCVVTGWGKCTSSATPSSILQQRIVTKLSASECDRESTWASKQNTFCIKTAPNGEGGRGLIDYGSPLVCSCDETATKWRLFGMASSCESANNIGTFANLNKYLEWIEFLTGVNEPRLPTEQTETPPPLPNPFPSAEPSLPPPPPPPPVPKIR